MTLSGKKALVSGGSRGIGRAIARMLATQGADVAINYRSDRAEAEATAAELTALSKKACCLQADVCDPPSAKRLVEDAIEQLGGLDILINNVGEFFFKKLGNTSGEEWERILRSNLFSVFDLCRAALPMFRRQRRGTIVNIGLSPVDRVRGATNVGAYSIAKTGVLVMTRTMAIEEAVHGIRVNCVSPGLIDNGYLPDEQRRWMQERVPMGRLGTNEEVAEAVAFLVSDKASYISGANLAVCGAWDWEDRPATHDQIVEGLFCEK